MSSSDDDLTLSETRGGNDGGSSSTDDERSLDLEGGDSDDDEDMDDFLDDTEEGVSTPAALNRSSSETRVLPPTQDMQDRLNRLQDRLVGSKRRAPSPENISPDRAQQAPRLVSKDSSGTFILTPKKIVRPVQPVAMETSSSSTEGEEGEPSKPKTHTERDLAELEKVEGAGFVKQDEEGSVREVLLLREHSRQRGEFPGIDVGQHFAYHSYMQLPKVVSGAIVVPSDDVPPFILDKKPRIGTDFVEYPPFGLTFAAEVSAYPATANTSVSLAREERDRALVWLYEVAELSGGALVGMSGRSNRNISNFESNYISRYLFNQDEIKLQLGLAIAEIRDQLEGESEKRIEAAEKRRRKTLRKEGRSKEEIERIMEELEGREMEDEVLGTRTDHALNFYQERFLQAMFDDPAKNPAQSSLRAHEIIMYEMRAVYRSERSRSKAEETKRSAEEIKRLTLRNRQDNQDRAWAFGKLRDNFVADMEFSEKHLRDALFEVVEAFQRGYELQQTTLDRAAPAAAPEPSEKKSGKPSFRRPGGSDSTSIEKEDACGAVALVTAMIESLNESKHANDKSPLPGRADILRDSMIIWLREMSSMLDIAPEIFFCLLVRLGDVRDLIYWMNEVFGADQRAQIIKALHSPSWDFVWSVADGYQFAHPLKMAALRHNYQIMYYLLRDLACHPSVGGDRDAGTIVDVIMASAAMNPDSNLSEACRCIVLCGLATQELHRADPHLGKIVGAENYIEQSMRVIANFHRHHHQHHGDRSPGSSSSPMYGIPIGVPEYIKIHRALSLSDSPHARPEDGHISREVISWMEEEFDSRALLPDYATNVIRVSRQVQHGQPIDSVQPALAVPVLHTLDLVGWNVYRREYQAFEEAFEELRRELESNVPRAATELGAQHFIEKCNMIRTRFESLPVAIRDLDNFVHEMIRVIDIERIKRGLGRSFPTPPPEPRPSLSPLMSPTSPKPAGTPRHKGKGDPSSTSTSTPSEVDDSEKRRELAQELGLPEVAARWSMARLIGAREVILRSRAERTEHAALTPPSPNKGVSPRQSPGETTLSKETLEQIIASAFTSAAATRDPGSSSSSSSSAEEIIANNIFKGVKDALATTPSPASKNNVSRQSKIFTKATAPPHLTRHSPSSSHPLKGAYDSLLSKIAAITHTTPRPDDVVALKMDQASFSSNSMRKIFGELNQEYPGLNLPSGKGRGWRQTLPQLFLRMRRLEKLTVPIAPKAKPTQLAADDPDEGSSSSSSSSASPWDQFCRYATWRDFDPDTLFEDMLTEDRHRVVPYIVPLLLPQYAPNIPLPSPSAPRNLSTIGQGGVSLSLGGPSPSQTKYSRVNCGRFASASTDPLNGQLADLSIGGGRGCN